MVAGGEGVPQFPRQRHQFLPCVGGDVLLVFSAPSFSSRAILRDAMVRRTKTTWWTSMSSAACRAADGGVGLAEDVAGDASCGAGRRSVGAAQVLVGHPASLAQPRQQRPVHRRRVVPGVGSRWVNSDQFFMLK